jgi:DNA-binding response OmpR family regulator
LLFFAIHHTVISIFIETIYTNPTQSLGAKYTVATAPSAKLLFSFLENNTPALILLDIDMPEMDGFEAIKILKTKPETRDIPVIFLSSHTEGTYMSLGLGLGAVDYINKPYEPSLLIERIETHLAN